ncbi:hypothetical protein P7C71_g3446, partial [Lecanoromycetidae sp. Uapishka_2]
MAEIGYHPPPDPRRQDVRADGYYYSIIASIIGVAGAGFRLSLLLNAVATEMANADCDIHNIAKGISLFSLMLKQVGKTMEEGKTVASQSAIETATEIRDQSELVFQEIERMVNLSQGRDEKGNIRSITITEKVKWCFKKQKVQYLLGQLESLKLSLSIMLQILQMGKAIAIKQAMLQERAEIQNMIVVQHWSLVELRKLYELAETEAREESMSPLIEDPPPRYDAHRTPEMGQHNDQTSSASTDNGLQLTLGVSPPVPPKVELDGHSQAIVKFQEKELHQLDESFSKAMTRENIVLNANVYDIVDHLLGEWTRTAQSPRTSLRSSPKDGRRNAYYSSDESDTTESEFEGHETKGRYIEGPRRSQKRGVNFQPSVESDQEDEERTRTRRRAPRKHVLHSESDTSSEEETTSTSPPLTRSQPHSRRSSDASNSRYNPNSRDSYERHRTPYTSGGLGNVPENPSRPTSSRGIPQPPMPTPARPQPQHYQTTPINSSSRGPSYHVPPPPPGPPRLPSAGQYMPAPPPGYMGASPQPPVGGYFPQGQRPPGPPGPPMPVPMPMPMQRPPRQHGHRTDHRHEREKAEKDRAIASKNLKRGLFAGAGIAGILDLLQGLDGL